MKPSKFVGYSRLRQEVVGESNVWVADLVTATETGELEASSFVVASDKANPEKGGSITAKIGTSKITLARISSEQEEMLASQRSELMKSRRDMKQKMRSLKKRPPKAKKYLGYAVFKATSPEGGGVASKAGKYVAKILVKMPSGRIMVQKQFIKTPSQKVTRDIKRGKKVIRTITLVKMSEAAYHKKLGGGGGKEEAPNKSVKKAAGVITTASVLAALYEIDEAEVKKAANADVVRINRDNIPLLQISASSDGEVEVRDASGRYLLASFDDLNQLPAYVRTCCTLTAAKVEEPATVSARPRAERRIPRRRFA